jgi:drug/metabolite transporter (DMT)-like permease
VKIIQRALLTVAICIAANYLLLHTCIPEVIEGVNEDGSSNITYRSVIAIFVVLGISAVLADRAVRARRAKQVLIGAMLGVSTCWCLFCLYSWEPHNADGTFPLTWRTNLLILIVVIGSQALSFASFWLINFIQVQCLQRSEKGTS